MPEPGASVRTAGQPPPLWPATLPNPQADSMRVTGPPRAEVCEVLYGPVRLRVHARTAPQEFTFSVWLTPAQFREFEEWYRYVVRVADGEFYARWIGGSRVVAFIAPYQITAIGQGVAVSGRLVRTRIDITACDAFISSVFTAIYRDDGVSPDIYLADLAATDYYVDQFDLELIAQNEC